MNTNYVPFCSDPDGRQDWVSTIIDSKKARDLGIFFGVGTTDHDNDGRTYQIGKFADGKYFYYGCTHGQISSREWWQPLDRFKGDHIIF